MAINRKHYHPKWRLISRLIRFRRADNHCEWCGIQNALLVRRHGKRDYTVLTERERADLKELIGLRADVLRGQLAALSIAPKHIERAVRQLQHRVLKQQRITRVILTVAHLDRNRDNNRFWNLAALCQKCHLGHDKDQHVANRRLGREWKRTVLKLAFITA